MNVEGAIRAAIRLSAGPQNIGYVTPVLAVALAAQRHWMLPNDPFDIAFSSAAQSYAHTIGLLRALEGRPLSASQRGPCSGNYSPLVSVSTEADVETSDTTINSLFRSKFEGFNKRFVNHLCKVVGELHDNVASHSRGMGFSAAQVWGGDRLEFAIADNGRGFLSAVKKKSGASTHIEALEWALKKGNTATEPSETWQQRYSPGAGDPVCDYGGQWKPSHGARTLRT
jgi:hypothetical protein